MKIHTQHELCTGKKARFLRTNLFLCIFLVILLVLSISTPIVPGAMISQKATSKLSSGIQTVTESSKTSISAPEISSTASIHTSATPTQSTILQVSINGPTEIQMGEPSSFTAHVTYQQQLGHDVRSAVKSVGTVNPLFNDQSISADDLNVDDVNEQNSDEEELPGVGTDPEDGSQVIPEEEQAEEPGVEPEEEPSLDPIAVQIRWDFNDDGTWDTSFSDTMTVQHTFENHGTFTVKVEASDTKATATDTHEIAVEEIMINQPPVASISFDDTNDYDIYEIILFDGSQSYDPDTTGSIISYQWTFGDTSTSLGAIQEHSYDQQGEFTVTLTVTDDKGATGSDSVFVQISSETNHLPVAIIEAPPFALINQEVTFDGSMSYDPDSTDQISSYEWSIDGAKHLGESVSYTFSTAGSYTITLSVTNTNGETGETNLVLLVASPNKPPIADAGGPYYGMVGQVLSFDGSSSYDPDPDGEIVEFQWDFGDGYTGSTQKTNHSYNKTGTYILTLVVTDDKDGVGSNSTIVYITNSTLVMDSMKPEISFVLSGENNRHCTLTISYPGVSKQLFYSIQWGQQGPTTQTPSLFSNVQVSSSFIFQKGGDFDISVIAFDTAGNQVGEPALKKVTIEQDTLSEQGAQQQESSVNFAFPLGPFGIYVLSILGVLSIVILGVFLYKRKSDHQSDYPF